MGLSSNKTHFRSNVKIDTDKDTGKFKVSVHIQVWGDRNGEKFNKTYDKNFEASSLLSALDTALEFEQEIQNKIEGGDKL